MNLPVYNNSGEKTEREALLVDSIFSVVPHEHSVYLDVRSILASKRQGTHKTKEKSDLSGSTRKLRKQKGSGFARVGSIKSPIFRGGARVFGPVSRDYSFKLNKKVKKLAKRSVLSQKKTDDEIVVIENMNFESHKTKVLCDFLKKFQLEGEKVLLVVSEYYKNLFLAARNLEKVKVVDVKSINTYDMLNANRILLEASSLESINELLK